MPNPEWGKRKTDEPIWGGPKAAEDVDLAGLDSASWNKIDEILEAMEWGQFVVFYYDGSDRVVAPIVVGVSSEGNPLMRGYQIAGISRSGRVGGWRVFQVGKMGNLENYQDFFEPSEFVFDRFYPWIDKVIMMI